MQVGLSRRSSGFYLRERFLWRKRCGLMRAPFGEIRFFRLMLVQNDWKRVRTRRHRVLIETPESERRPITSAEASTGRKYCTIRHTTKPAATSEPNIGANKNAKPPSAPPVPPGSGTAEVSNSIIDPQARQVRKSASMPNALSTNHGRENCHPSWMRVTTSVASIRRQSRAA